MSAGPGIADAVRDLLRTGQLAPLEAYLARLPTQTPDTRVITYIVAYQVGATDEQLQLLQRYLPLAEKDVVRVIRILLRNASRGNGDFDVLDRFPPRAVLSALDEEIETLDEEQLAPLAHTALRRITDPIPEDVVEAQTWGDYPVMTDLMNRLPKPPSPDEITAVGTIIGAMLRSRGNRRPGDAVVLRQYLRRGGLLSVGQSTAVGPQLVEMLNPSRAGDQDLLRTMYERGYVTHFLPGTQVAVLSGEGLWSAMRHPEAWPLTVHALVQQAGQVLETVRNGLGAVLSPDLVRYISQVL